MIGWDIFDFSSETWQEARSHCPLPSLFFRRSQNKDAMHGHTVSNWLTHFDFSSETAERNSTKLDRKQNLNVLYQVCVFGLIRKPRRSSQPLIGWEICDFCSETTELNSTNLGSLQDLNVLYQVCVFRAGQKTKMAIIANPSTKVAHFTQVHDMWSFMPHVNLILNISPNTSKSSYLQ